jgi:hypothetical protein
MCSSMYLLECMNTSVCGLGRPPSYPLLPAGRAPSFSPLILPSTLSPFGEEGVFRAKAEKAATDPECTMLVWDTAVTIQSSAQSIQLSTYMRSVIFVEMKLQPSHESDTAPIVLSWVHQQMAMQCSICSSSLIGITRADWGKSATEKTSAPQLST